MDLQRAVSPNPYDYLPAVPSFTVTSSDITEGAVIDMRCVHDSAGGGNASPQLSWSGFPPETKSFAVTCFDPDAPTLSGWWHWQVADLPATTTELAHGAGEPDGSGLPASAVQFRTDFGSFGYQGSAPPPGDYPHRYIFAVHALDTEALGLAADTPAAVVGFHLTAHTLARATLMCTYQH